jgi:hypothetical protein
MKRKFKLFILMLFPVYSFLSWIYIYNYHELSQQSRVKIYENNYFLGLDSNLISLISISLLLFAVYLLVKQLYFRQNIVLSSILLLIILFLLFYNIWSLL